MCFSPNCHDQISLPRLRGMRGVVPQINKNEHVSNDHHQMSLPVGRVGVPGMMSREVGGRSQVLCPWETVQGKGYPTM